MNNNKKWKTKEEAQDYISKAFENKCFGLSFCAACDFLDIDKEGRVAELKEFYLGLLADCFINLNEKQSKDFISQLEYQV